MDCAACDGELVPGAAFCGHCGVPLEAVAEPLAEPVYPDPPDQDLDPRAMRVEGPDGPGDSARHPRRLRYLVAVAAAVVLFIGIAIARGNSGDDQVTAEGTTTTTARSNTTVRAENGRAADDDSGVTEEPVSGDAPAPDATAGPVPQAPSSAALVPDAGSLTGAPADQNPPPALPPPPPTSPPPTSPPTPAALVVVSECVSRCEIQRGGRVELRVINFGGRPGRFTVVVSEGIDPRPGQGSVGGGDTRIVELVETAGKRRAYRVDVVDENDQLLFRTNVSVGG